MYRQNSLYVFVGSAHESVVLLAKIIAEMRTVLHSDFWSDLMQRVAP